MNRTFYLIKGRVESKELPMAISHTLFFIVPVNLLIRGTVEEVREEGIREGILQVKNAAGPAAPWSVIYRHGPPLQIILNGNKLVKIVLQALFVKLHICTLSILTSQTEL